MRFVSWSCLCTLVFCALTHFSALLAKMPASLSVSPPPGLRADWPKQGPGTPFEAPASGIQYTRDTLNSDTLFVFT